MDGVLLIGEHGDYPANKWGQKMYPRRELFDEIVQVFRDSGRCVPVFSDKHLSYDDDSAIHMVNTAKEMGVSVDGWLIDSYQCRIGISEIATKPSAAGSGRDFLWGDLWPAAYCFTHRGGFRSTHINLNGHVRGNAIAMRETDGAIIITHSKTVPNSEALFYLHFVMFNVRIEEFMLGGKSPYPVEHYLLTTLAISAGMRALAQPGKPLLTPQIDMEYFTIK